MTKTKPRASFQLPLALYIVNKKQNVSIKNKIHGIISRLKRPEVTVNSPRESTNSGKPSKLKRYLDQEASNRGLKIAKPSPTRERNVRTLQLVCRKSFRKCRKQVYTLLFDLFNIDYTIDSPVRFKYAMESRTVQPALGSGSIVPILKILHAFLIPVDDKDILVENHIWSYIRSQNVSESVGFEFYPSVFKQLLKVDFVIFSSIECAADTHLEGRIEDQTSNMLNYLYDPIFTKMESDEEFVDDLIDLLDEFVALELKIIVFILLTKYELVDYSENGFRDPSVLERLQQVLTEKYEQSPALIAKVQVPDLLRTYSTSKYRINIDLVWELATATDTRLLRKLALYYLQLIQLLIVKLGTRRDSWDEDESYITSIRLRLVSYLRVLEDSKLLSFYLSMIWV